MTCKPKWTRSYLARSKKRRDRRIGRFGNARRQNSRRQLPLATTPRRQRLKHHRRRHKIQENSHVRHQGPNDLKEAMVSQFKNLPSCPRMTLCSALKVSCHRNPHLNSPPQRRQQRRTLLARKSSTALRTISQKKARFSLTKTSLLRVRKSPRSRHSNLPQKPTVQSKTKVNSCLKSAHQTIART